MTLAALKMPLPILRALIHYMVILALFAGFVLWNGGVVLGEYGFDRHLNKD